MKQKRQETGMGEQGPAGQNEGKEEKLQAVEAGMGGLGRIQGCHLDMQKWDQESQGADGVELGKQCEKCQEKIL